MNHCEDEIISHHYFLICNVKKLIEGVPKILEKKLNNLWTWLEQAAKYFAYVKQPACVSSYRLSVNEVWNTSNVYVHLLCENTAYM